jgi:feruloyl esterase
MLANPASNIPAAKMRAIETAAINSCDVVDGLKDGLIDDPRRCSFDPSVLLCKGADGDNCLTAPQVATLKKIYSGLRAKNGIPSILPGGESASSWDVLIPGMKIFAGEFYKNFVFEDQKWDMKMLNLERDAKFADQKLGDILNATNPDLKAFNKRGGKLIMYHGWNDAVIPPEMSINYYKQVVSKTGQRETDRFLKLYMVPGMTHCALGNGPNTFGQILECKNCDAKRDITIALERWVEQGVAPNEIIATKYKGDNVQSEVVRTRPLCPYPTVARYKGSGSIDDAENFVCQAAK